MKMKRTFVVSLMLLFCLSSDRYLEAKDAAQADVIHVGTALDHLTVLEFGEPVTMAAAGSSSFQIEWKDNKVFVKPLKAAASTDLFVWTAKKRFNYELTTEEVKSMTFAMDSSAPVAKPTPEVHPAMDQIADMVLTQAFLNAERVDSTYIKDRKGRVTVRVDHVFRSSSSLYIHYSIRNQSERPYRIVAPEVRQLTVSDSRFSLVSMRRRQLNEDSIKALGMVKQSSIALAHAETGKTDLAPGEETEGVVAMRSQFPDLTLFELVFIPEGGHSVQAIFVR